MTSPFDSWMRLGVFCGSSPTIPSFYTDIARSFGNHLAARGIGLVYGGASVGMMGALADAALAGGVEVLGVIPRQLLHLELAHRGLSHLYVVGDMHKRKALMARLSDAFVALPGGSGTLDEFFEIWTWAQLGLHRKPCALLNARDYYVPFLQMVDTMVREGFMSPEYRDMLIVDENPDSVIDRLLAYSAPPQKWRERISGSTPPTPNG